MKGYTQVYTGNGKGKTTCALGLSLRAVCNGMKVYFGQFLKGTKYSELKAPQYLPNFVIEQFGKEGFIMGNPTPADIKLGSDAMDKIESVVMSGEYDIVVLDEVCGSIALGVVELDRVLKLIDDKPEHVELVMTGRYAPKELIEKADLVTDMTKIKHYFDEGVQAREGIEK